MIGRLSEGLGLGADVLIREAKPTGKRAARKRATLEADTRAIERSFTGEISG
jgi:hypothetical protein